MGMDIAVEISAGSLFPFPLNGIEPGQTVIVGRLPGAGLDGSTGTYLGHTLDSLAVVRIDGLKIDWGCGVGVEEWPADLVEAAS